MVGAKKIINKKGNIAILGETRSGKSHVLKSILCYCGKENKKVLMIEALKEYKELTSQLDGTYCVYHNLETIKYDNYLTVLTFDLFKKGSERARSIENLLKIIDSAIDNGVEIIIIDEAYCYLNECEKIFDRLSEQSLKLIVGSQFGLSILDKYWGENRFKNLFDTVIVMQSDSYMHGEYKQLLELYNIADPELVLRLIKDRKRGEATIIEEKKIEFNIA